MRVKRIAVLLMPLLILAFIFSGCAPKNGSASTTGTTASAVTETVAPSEASADSFKEPMEITVSQWDDGNWEQSPKDTWLKDLGKKFNVTFKPVVITWDDWIDKTRLWAASGNLPDLFVHDENYLQWVSQGLFKPIPLSLLDKYPNVKGTIMPDLLNALTVNGNIYSIPKSSYPDPAKAMASDGIFVRKDFLEKAGLTTPPDTLDGWYEFMKKAVKEDFSGTGKTIGIKGTNPSFLQNGLILDLPFIKTAANWMEEDGKWIPTAFSKRHIEELEFSRKLFKEGIMDPDFSVRKVFDERALFQQGRLAIMQANNDPGMLSQQITSDMKNVTPMDFIVLAMPPKADDGKRYFPYTLNYGFYSGISPKVTDDKLTRILAILDYLATPEGQLLSIFGKEGVDWKSKDGSKVTSPNQAENIETLLPKDPGSGKQLAMTEVYPSSWFGNCFPSWTGWVNAISPTYSPELRKMSSDYVENLRSNVTILPPNLKIQFMNSPEKTKLPDMSVLYNEFYIKLVMSDEDIVTTFNKWRSEQLDKYKAAIDEVNNNLK